MKIQLTKRIAIATFGTVLGLLGLASGQLTANADSFNTISRSDYVKTTRAMYTGQYYWNNGKRGSKIITPKGTILRNDGVGEDRTSTGSFKYSINLSRGDLHHDAEKHIDETGRPIAFKSSDFKAYHPKMSVRTRVLQSGTGYTHDATNRYKPMFHITLDGYLEYYNSALLKKYQIYDPNEMNELRDLPNGSNTAFTPYYLNLIKPTASRKVSTYRIKGNSTYLYYSKPIYGLTEKKVSSHSYRLTITKQGPTFSKTWHNTDEDFTVAQWDRYTVGGHNFYDIISVENGD